MNLKKLIYLHCIANYPVEIGNQNLKSINWLINQKIKKLGIQAMISIIMFVC